jgi:hypothetical protein
MQVRKESNGVQFREDKQIVIPMRGSIARGICFPENEAHSSRQNRRFGMTRIALY